KPRASAPSAAPATGAALERSAARLSSDEMRRSRVATTTTSATVAAASVAAKKFNARAAAAPPAMSATGQPSSVSRSEPGGEYTPSVAAASEYPLESHQVMVG